METKSQKANDCLLCKRETSVSYHHLIPRTLHKKTWYQKKYSREELNEGIYVCEDCHEAIHDFISEKDLGKYYNTVSLLLEHDKVNKFVRWISKKGGRHKSHRSKSR